MKFHEKIFLAFGIDIRCIFLPYEEAEAFVRKLGLKSQCDWYKYCKSGKKPENIPSHPEKTYKGKGWNGWGDWLGTGRKPRRIDRKL